MPCTRRLAEISDATTLQMLDDLGGNYPELVVVPRHMPARPELAGLAKCLLDIEQQFLVLRPGGDRRPWCEHVMRTYREQLRDGNSVGDDVATSGMPKRTGNRLHGNGGLVSYS